MPGAGYRCRPPGSTLSGTIAKGRPDPRPEAKWFVGILVAVTVNVNTKSKWIDGWRIRNWVDAMFAWTSFVVFVVLEAAIFYSYCVFLRVIH